MKGVVYFTLVFLGTTAFSKSIHEILAVVDQTIVVSSRLLKVDTGLRAEHSVETKDVEGKCVQELHELYNDQASLAYILTTSIDKRQDLSEELFREEEKLKVRYIYYCI